MTPGGDVDRVRALYDRRARTWKWLAVPDTIFGINRLRRRHFSSAMGDTLDVGCGTGENFAYLTSADSITAVDLSAEMIARARERADSLGANVEFEVADAARLPFEDASFDTVVSALSVCTFPDYVGALREMVRVCRPGGKVLLLEHGRSSVGWIGRRQDRMLGRSLQVTACRFNRDPLSDLSAAGLDPTRDAVSHLGIFHRLTIDVV